MVSFNKKLFIFLITATTAAVIAVIWRSSGSKMPCLFCRIVNKELATEFLYEDERYLAFKDIRPDAQHHLLLIPKEHIMNTNELVTADHRKMIEDMKKIMLDLLAKNNQTDINEIRLGFHVSPFHSVKHLHLHGLSPTSSLGFFGRMSFRPDSFWFKTVDTIISSLPEK